MNGGRGYCGQSALRRRRAGRAHLRHDLERRTREPLRLIRLPPAQQFSDRRVTAGRLQFVISFVRPVGLGSLLEQLERLKTKLRLEGLFERERKRPRV